MEEISYALEKGHNHSLNQNKPNVELYTLQTGYRRVESAKDVKDSDLIREGGGWGLTLVQSPHPFTPQTTCTK